ncbi:MAG: signal recognition particle-docking protein FtsY [Calditrichaeota bacterium]|nr:signal recognition particle-docking protein FtsY [Calditrichota bacterium]
MAAFLDKLRKGLARTKSQVFDRISRVIVARSRIDDELLEEIEEILISGDVGVETTLAILERVQQRVKKERYEDPRELFRILKEEIIRIFPPVNVPEETLPAKPFVILVVGVNGTGKTTSIAKLAHRFQQRGKRVVLGAADTFRAAAIEQLEVWARRLGADIVKHQSGADPGAVAYDTVQAAIARNADVAILDTAGRLHTKVNLMEELKKIKRVIQKVLPEAPHQVLLVLDGTVGQNALNQARNFVDAVGVTGIILTKLDGTAKGGSVIGIAHQLGIPIHYVGLGEQMEDLEVFDPQTFVDGLFETESITENS